ncbi:hypothetical protein CBK19_24845 [Salmonella enterica subsp. enterica serovar Hillingdon]|nr:hypothetical protein [Salmonella enterica]EBG0542767.1 hypothetical protein [Salmonella enterica subsp. enterica serovar Ank]EBW2268874.1 hypothetical protein [Salmonella enterica subsp. enterica serovar Hillingdon]ECB1325815.1 hypothetical protein [Salmonella enterica subsp. enterica serovar Nigeria]ECE5861121.1 hypothetical protein [Salmonella enterica subsp. enterica]ECF4097430.1 hypothetical protein [Salmonella enterica subsp. enterica serovar Adelaide]ECY9928057.1 ash family protein [
MVGCVGQPKGWPVPLTR